MCNEKCEENNYLCEKLKTYENRLKNALYKKVEVMKLRYEKCMSSRVFKEPLRNINDNYLKVVSL